MSHVMCPWCFRGVRAGIEAFDREGNPATWHAECAWRAQSAALRARKGQPEVVPPPAREGRADFVAAAEAGPPERCLADEQDRPEPSGAPYQDASARRYERDRHRRLSRKERALALGALYGEKERRRLMAKEAEK